MHVKHKEVTSIEKAIPRILLANQCFLSTYHTQNPVAGIPAINSDNVSSNAVIHKQSHKGRTLCQTYKNIYIEILIL